MPHREKPRVHARDHEHGGADPQRIHYEDVGDSGDGGDGAAALVIADEGTPLPARGTLDFQGDGVTATDDSGSDSTIVTIPGGGGGGVQFETYPQTGGWLYIEAEDATAAGGSPGGHGILLYDNDAGGIWVESSSAEGIQFTSSSGSFLFRAPSSPSVDFSVYVGGDIFLRSAANVIFGGPGEELLKVTASGTYHILSGASWVADL